MSVMVGCEFNEEMKTENTLHYCLWISQIYLVGYSCFLFFFRLYIVCDSVFHSMNNGIKNLLHF